MCWISERMKERDGDRLDLLRKQRVDRALGVARIQWPFDDPKGTDALIDDLAQVALDQRRGLGPADVVHARHAQRADLEHVAEAFRRDEAGLRAAVLEDRVRRHRGAVADLLDRAAGEAGLAEYLGQAVDDRLGVVLDARGDL